MRVFRYRLPILLLAAALLAAPRAEAANVLQMDLGDLTQRAERIFRGTVIDVEQGSVEAGGADLPAVTYRLRVEESFKGGADLVEADQEIIEVQMLGSIKAEVPLGGYRRFAVFQDTPRLTMGSDYLLFTTPASPIGLSTTVGLGQGAFMVFLQDVEEVAVNKFNNVGLGLTDDGPAPYSEIATKILTLLGR